MAQAALLDRRHEPVCHPVRFAFSRISTMSTSWLGDQPPNSVARVWPTSKPCKGWPAATASRLAALTGTCWSAFVGHQEFDGEVRLMAVPSQTFNLTETCV